MQTDILTVGFVSLLAGAIRMSMPILLPALGEIFTQRSGILNLGLEGIMLMGALAGFAGTFFTQNLWVGLLAAVITGILFSLIMGFLSITVKANQVIAGTAITILGTGLSTFLFREMFGIQKLPPQIESFAPLEIPLLSDIPFLGPVLFNHNAMIYLTLILVVFTAFVLEKTRFGLQVRAVGENPRAADSKGINVALVRYLCVMIGGAFAGLGGAFLSIGFMNTFIDGMVAGRGFIAVAVVIFARWNPYRALGAALLFGGASALQMRLQAIGVPIPHQFLLALPYALTILVLLSVSKKAEFPAAYTLPYSRSER
ncbi:ABC transporter permease [Desulfosporosinus youngiae]|uniref:Putative ABC-type transport system, permease component n=1 Tax=Desulfosporosinus youngiae DSM 17734 TaxID=768710 RepID=H5XXD3_9FIRM|nr:ABC transporter permease [Desulfosporosinus youngiae]EHQ91139.1 putative ABC-type transport system, permease component [Desulfosporosinus youngiae DSM 17734]